MASITTLVGTDGITTANSMTKINTNFANLNSDKIETSTLDTDNTLAANSDTKIASQKAVKAYIDAAPSTPTSVHPHTQVFNSSCSGVSSFTDLNLSAVVGSKQKMVFLKVIKTQGNNGNQCFHFRRNGDTGTPYLSTNHDVGGGVSSTGYLESGQTAYVMTETDTSGVIEWMGNVVNGGDIITISVEAYW